jgi:acyl-CoA thioesterase FadM
MLSRHALLAGPRAFVYPTRVRFADSVGGGRLFYPKMLGLFHDAYEALLDAHGLPLHRVLRDGIWGAPLAHTSLELLGEPPTYGTELDIVITAAQLGSHRVTFGYRAQERATERVIAMGTTIHAFVDLETFKKCDVPESVRNIVGAIGAQAATDDELRGMSAALREELLRAEPRFSHRLIVTFEDVDAAGFVFFARTCSFFHHAYSALRRRRGEAIDEHASEPRSRIIGTNADFLRPLRAGDEIDVFIVSSAFEAEEATIGLRIERPQGGPIALGTLVHTAGTRVELPPAP